MELIGYPPFANLDRCGRFPEKIDLELVKTITNSILWSEPN